MGSGSARSKPWFGHGDDDDDDDDDGSRVDEINPALPKIRNIP